MSDESKATGSAVDEATRYFETIPIWTESPQGKRFEIMADKVSGRIPVTRLERWQDFAAVLEDPFFNRPGVHLVYRGHRRFDWGLLPTLGRLNQNGIVSRDLADQQLTRFRRAIRGRIEDRALLEYDEDDHQSDELWAVGQHHGLMTPLLDWTYSPFVALFFAFAQTDVVGEKDNPHRAVYLLNKTFLETSARSSDIRILEPRKDDHGRLVNQAGLFTFSPYDATIENKLTDVLADPNFEDDALRNADDKQQAEILAKYICKMYVPNDDREGCLRQLRRMNVHHASLFPDLLGASEYCNILSEEETREKEIQHEAAMVLETASRVPGASAGPEDSAEASARGDSDGNGIRRVELEGMLREPPEAAQVEPGRIQMIAKELKAALEQETAVDWKDRESVQARLRVIAKIHLRKYGYPTTIRDEMAERLVARMVAKE